jgi:anti-sigma regulatory factor (Ser/Thr protein kinase)
MSQTLDLTFSSGSLKALRAAVQDYADQAGMPPDRAIDLVLAVHELAANAVRHGAGTGRVRMWTQPEGLRCEVQDAGPAARESQAGHEGPRDDPGPDPGPDPDSGQDPGSDAGLADPWSYVDGHGLWVARKVADRMQVRSGPGGTRAMVMFELVSGC